MAFLGVVLLALCFADEVVELEPVQANMNCPAFTSQSTCESFPFCIWVVGASTGCFNDPCLVVVDDASTSNSACPGANNVFGSGPVICELATWTTADGGEFCNSGTPANHKYCHYPSLPSYPHMTYCAFNYLKSGNSTCDPYFCNPAATSTGGTFCDQIAPRDRTDCSQLVSEAYCKLNPHCYWNSVTFGTSSCLRDTCTDHDGPTANCDMQTNTNNGGRQCSSIQVYDGASSTAGTTKILCVDPDKNPKPNKCFDLAEGGTENSNRPSTGTGACKTYTLPRCAANEECKAQVGTTGPFADYYCGDKDHTSPDSSILVHIPAFLILLLVAFVAL